MARSSIVCPNCQRGVTPRLWLVSGYFFTDDKTQHLCPFCGVVMYENGGNTTVIGHIAIYLVLIFAAGILGEFGDIGKVIGFALFVFVNYIFIIRPFIRPFKKLVDTTLCAIKWIRNKLIK